jgi:hypothetical protein
MRRRRNQGHVFARVLFFLSAFGLMVLGLMNRKPRDLSSGEGVAVETPSRYTPLGHSGIKFRGATSGARLASALGTSDTVKPHSYLLTQLREQEWVLADVVGKVNAGDLQSKLKPLFKEDGGEAIWWASDQKAAAQAVKDAGAKYFLLHREVLPSVDRGSAVLSRLYHDDHHPWFNLVAVDERFFLYKVLDEPFSFPPELAGAALKGVREQLMGRPGVRFPATMKAGNGKKWNLLAVARLEGGRELATGMCINDRFDGCIAELSRDLEREYRRYAEWFGLGAIEEIAPELVLEIQRITDRTRVLTWGGDDLEIFFEMGIDGAVIVDKVSKKKRAGVLPGYVSYTRGNRDIDRLLREVAKQGHLSSKRPWRDARNTLDKIRGITYQDRPGMGLIPLVRGVPPVPLISMDLERMEDLVTMAGDWYLANLAEENVNHRTMGYEPGQVTYKFWPSENRFSNEYNLVRHTLATWNLVQAYTIDPRPEYLEGARSALDWTLKYRVDEGNMSFIEYKNNRKLGSVVVGLMGLIDLARATDDHQWDDLINRFGEFTLFMQEDSGKFDPYYVPDDHPYANETNDIVPGEAALALVMLYEYTGDDKWLVPLPKFFDYYMPWWDERVKRGNTDEPWPAHTYKNADRLELVQFGPWSVMAANAFHRASGDERAAEFGLRVARWMIDTYQFHEEKTPWPDYVGGYFKMNGELPAMQTFCYGEGTAAAYQLALRFAPDEAPFFEKSTREMARIAVQMQFDPYQTYAFPRGKLVEGGIRYALNETKVRIDYVHHGLSAVYQYILAARTDTALPDIVKRSPLRDKIEAVRAARSVGE